MYDNSKQYWIQRAILPVDGHLPPRTRTGRPLDAFKGQKVPIEALNIVMLSKIFLLQIR